jgi:hypothetical protein
MAKNITPEQCALGSQEGSPECNCLDGLTNLVQKKLNKKKGIKKLKTQEYLLQESKGKTV